MIVLSLEKTILSVMDDTRINEPVENLSHAISGNGFSMSMRSPTIFSKIREYMDEYVFITLKKGVNPKNLFDIFL